MSSDVLVDPQWAKVSVMRQHFRLSRYDKRVVRNLNRKYERRVFYKEDERYIIETLWYRYRKQHRQIIRR